MHGCSLSDASFLLARNRSQDNSDRNALTKFKSLFPPALASGLLVPWLFPPQVCAFADARLFN